MSKDTKRTNEEQLQHGYDPRQEEMDGEFANALEDLTLAARKLKLKGGLKGHGMAEGTLAQ